MPNETITLESGLAWFISSLDHLITANLARFDAFELCKKGPFEETRDEYWRLTVDIEADLRTLCDGAKPLAFAITQMSSDEVEAGWRDDVLQLIRQNLEALMDLLFLRPWPNVQFDYSAGLKLERFNQVLARVSESRAALVQRIIQLLDWLDAQETNAESEKSESVSTSRLDRRIACETKFVAALRAHHGYDTESYRHTPISGVELGRQTGFSPATVSRWFKRKLPDEGYEGYERICAANGVHKWLESLSGESSFGTLAEMDDFASNDE